MIDTSTLGKRAYGSESGFVATTIGHDYKFVRGQIGQRSVSKRTGGSTGRFIEDSASDIDSSLTPTLSKQ